MNEHNIFREVQPPTQGHHSSEKGDSTSDVWKWKSLKAVLGIMKEFSYWHFKLI